MMKLYIIVLLLFYIQLSLSRKFIIPVKPVPEIMSTQTSIITPLYDPNLGFNAPSATSTTISLVGSPIIGGAFAGDNTFNVFRSIQIISMSSNDEFLTYYLQQVLQAPSTSYSFSSITSNDEFTIVLNSNGSDVVVNKRDDYNNLSFYTLITIPVGDFTDLYAISGIFNNFFILSDRGVHTPAGKGAIYVYTINNNTGIWSLYQTITTALPLFYTYSFMDLRMYDTTFVVGLPYLDDQGVDSGASYVYEYESNLWQYKQKLIPSRAIVFFGWKVDIYGDYMIICGARNKAIGTTNYAYVFKKTSGVWGEIQELVISKALASTDEPAVAISENCLAFGSFNPSVATSGFVDLYHLNTGTGLFVYDSTYDNTSFGGNPTSGLATFLSASNDVITSLFNKDDDEVIAFKYNVPAGTWGYTRKVINIENTYNAFRNTKNFIITSRDILSGFYDITFKLKAVIKTYNINEANNKIYFYENGQYKYTTITIQNYADMSAVATAVQTAMNTASGGYNTYTITYDATWHEVLITATNPFTFMPESTNTLWYKDSLTDKVFGISNTQTLAKSIKSYRPVFLESEIEDIGISIEEGYSTEYSRECNLQKEIQSIAELNSAGTYYITPTTKNYQINFKQDTQTFHISFVDTETGTEFDVQTFNWKIILTRS